jgi:two-component system KDP operon response regulator KdpE
MTDRILIIDDEPAIAGTLDPVLASQGYEVRTAGSAAEGLAAAKAEAFDIVLLDLGLPDADGKEIISALRGLNNMAILVISARHQETEKVAALDEGADDFINKPFSIDELLARIRVALRRLRGEARANEYRSPDLVISYDRRQVSLMGEDIKLSPKEFDLLEALARKGGQVVTHRRLLLAGWKDPSIDGQYLRSYIGLLRQKLEEDPAEPRFILTESGVGYRLATPSLEK